MITFIKGTLVEKQPTRVVVDVGGVGYEILISLGSYDDLPPAGETCKLLTCDHVREDQHTLFGFRTEAEREMFLLLMEVGGIGPKIALSALSGMPLRDLAGAIAGGDSARLSSISGIGRKKADRIVLELRDKIGQASALEALYGEKAFAETDEKTRDAILALISLGYKQSEARARVAKIKGADGAAEVEDIVRKALTGD